MIEEWETIPDFTNYKISNYGEVFNVKRNSIMRVSKTLAGHLKITLVCDIDNRRYTRSVAQMVAQAFVEAPNLLCDTVMILDGDHNHVAAYNLAWRPQWFAWKYTRQLKIAQPHQYHNLPVINLKTGKQYFNILEAGVAEGLLFDDIWRSTYTGAEIFPHDSTFEIR